MKKITKILLGVLILLSGIFFYAEYEINQSIKTSLLEDKSIKNIEKVDCSIILNKCAIKNIDFHNSESKIGNIKIENIYDIISMQTNGIKENKKYQTKITFSDVKNPFENNPMISSLSNELKTQLNKDMSYSFDVNFIKNDDFYNTDLKINISQDKFQLDTSFNGILKIDQHLQLIQALSSVKNFQTTISDKNQLINRFMFDMYENMLEIFEPQELNHQLFGVNYSDKLSQDDISLIVVSLIKEASKVNKDILIESDNPTNIELKLINNNLTIDELLSIQNENFLKNFIITLK